MDLCQILKADIGYQSRRLEWAAWAKGVSRVCVNIAVANSIGIIGINIKNLEGKGESSGKPSLCQWRRT
jgi:hypothetical protein